MTQRHKDRLVLVDRSRSTLSALAAQLVDWWKRRRRRRTLSEIGAKSRKRIADLVQALRDNSQPRPVLQPAPGGAV